VSHNSQPSAKKARLTRSSRGPLIDSGCSTMPAGGVAVGPSSAALVGRKGSCAACAYPRILSSAMLVYAASGSDHSREQESRCSLHC
jgi:hypothetical protein